MTRCPKCNECGEELEGGENYCPICGNQLVLKSERESRGNRLGEAKAEARYILGDMIRRAFLKHGHDAWCSIADDVLTEIEASSARRTL